MGAILLVSDRENWAASFEKLLKEELQAEVRTASSNGMARECMNSAEYALVLILTPFAGDNGLYLARQALETSAGVLIACSPSYSLQYDSSVTDEGIFVYNTGMGRRFLADAVRLTMAQHVRLSRAQRPEVQQYQDRIRELRAVDRAKCLLIQYQQMTEKEAHRWIEKKAMDRRCGKREIAEEILRLYELE